ncbi:MAG: pyridoxal phosphate-dependent aminotransferase [Candidatus Dormibacteraceae bacterium]
MIRAADEAARQGFTRYGPNGGFLSLRRLLAEKIRTVDGYSPEPEQVVATPGGMNALFSIYLSLLNAGDEVLLPTPGFPNMDEMVRLLGGIPVFYTLSAEEGYLPNIARLDALISPKTRAIFINTPANPTGAVFPGALVEELVALARRRDVWLIADEVYDQLVLDENREHVAAGRFDNDGHVISVYSFSKVYAMTGWRLGYCVAPPRLADVLRKLQEPQVSCPSSISQKAAEAALTGDPGVVETMRRAYVARRDLAWDLANELGINAFRTQGTFYMLLDISRTALTPREFTMRLLDKHGVTVAPGEVFGPGGKDVVRISLAVEPQQIQEGLQRIAVGLRTETVPA